MKSYSALKRNKFEPELNQRIQSKLLITTISKQGTPNPSAILSRYDHLRHEEQFQKEYNLKFMTDRKRNTSAKKLSSTKRSAKEAKRQKMGETVEPQRLFFDGDEFKQKYYNLHQTHLRDKEKWITDAEKLLSIKEALYDFFSSPDQASASGLAQLLDSDKISKMLGKFVTKSSKLQETEELIAEVMKILQVQRREDILGNLRARVQRFRNLDQCTFKVLELESTNRKVVVEFEERIKKMKRELEDSSRKEMERVREEFQLCRRSKLFLQEELALHKEQYTMLLEDLTSLQQSEDQTTSKWKSGRPEVIEVHKLIRSLSHKLRDIEVEAQDNMFRLVKSNEDILKLQQLMSLIKDDMNKQLLEQEDANQQNQCQITHLNNKIKQMEHQICQKNQEINKSDDRIARIQRQYQDELSLIASFLGLKQTHSSKINLTIQQLNRQLASARLKIEHQEECLKDKDQLIRDMSKQIEKLSRSSSQIKDSAKTALYEKQQYKFLLNNLRDQVCQMKKQHSQQINQLLREKDEEIVSSNRDILTSYTNLKEEHQAVKNEAGKLRKVADQNKIELAVLKNKEQQISANLRDRQIQIAKLTQENQRYKKYLKEIEASFKEVVEMEQVSSKTVAKLESDNRENCRIVKVYQSKNQQLQRANSELIQTRNQAKTELKRCSGDLAQVQAQRLKLESTNVELRLETISQQNQINRLGEQLKNASKEAKSYKLGNEKLLGELNSVTRKLVMFRLQMKKKYTEQYKVMCQQMCELRQLQQILKREVQNDLNVLLGWINGSISEMLQKEVFLAEFHRMEAEKVRKMHQSQQQRYLQQLNHIKIQYEKHFIIRQNQIPTPHSQQVQQHLQEKHEIQPKQLPSLKQVTHQGFFSAIDHHQSQHQQQRTETIEIGTQCNILSSIRKQTLVVKLYSSYADVQCLLKENQQLHRDLNQIKTIIDEQCLDFLAWLESQATTRLLNCEQKALRRKDTPFFIEVNSNSSLQNHNQIVQQQELICNDLEDYNSNEEAHILTSDLEKEKDKEDQGEIVNNILQILADNDTEIPSVPYWKTIQTNFLSIRRKLTKKPCNLKLDLSAIDSKEPPQQSPHSVNFGESSFFGRRIGSEPDEMMDLRQFGNKETNRSEKTPVQMQLNQALRQENEELRQKLLAQVEAKAEIEQKREQLQMRLQQLQIKLISLQNQTSIKGLEHNLKKLLDYLLAENGELFEQTCRVMMKMLHFSSGEIQDYEEKMSSKKKKKKGGLFSSLFKT